MTLHPLMSSLLAATDVTDAVQRVGSGRIVGGWEYVWACYGITLFVLFAYALSLWVRRPAARTKDTV